MSDSTVFDTDGHLGIVTLNRPQVLNALSHDMIVAIARQLAAWEHDDSVRAVLLRGSGERAFCAGGDIRSMYDGYHDGSRSYTRFFLDEYRLDHQLWRYAKPVIALMDGITMGGGMGLAQAATLRIATDKTRMAMPETGIGLIPDVGGTFFLSRMAPHLAFYLGLTGNSIHAGDALYCGLADVHVGVESLEDLLATLNDIDWSGNLHTREMRLRAAVAPLAKPLAETPPLARLAAPLMRHFGQPSVRAITESLAGESGEHAQWASETLATLGHRSPLSMHLVYRQLTEGRKLDLADCFRLEYNLVIRAIEEGDLIEGVRALIVDKDKNPRWDPARVADVDDARVAAFFAEDVANPAHPLADLDA
ncbi:enoyl-CoA hydratase/isomerase family protein [Verticiella sediminum]|uniref:3-hydroxyisobutyryl-CoA hydrolase n=1 Tax=Verticiella sediminum TaxID=1247510 RepID=A0A556ADU6_9BURK|nr:enoyl-CoA hydratase/isomerase family protein [Verticiella sediminum]TSH91062.1 enoyl-CoA hydratase/isomerase family protein [Verticiella sediminum]